MGSGVVVDKTVQLQFDVGIERRGELLSGAPGAVDQHPLQRLAAQIGPHHQLAQQEPEPRGRDQQDHRRDDKKLHRDVGADGNAGGDTRKTYRHCHETGLQNALELIGDELFPVQSEVKDDRKTDREHHRKIGQAGPQNLQGGHPADQKRIGADKGKDDQREVDAGDDEALLAPAHPNQKTVQHQSTSGKIPSS